MHVSVQDLSAAMADGAFVLDVREPDEWAEVHLQGAVLVPMASIPANLDQLPADEPVYVICHVGARSAVAAAWLSRQGLDARNVVGGMDAWIAAGLPATFGS